MDVDEGSDKTLDLKLCWICRYLGLCNKHRNIVCWRIIGLNLFLMQLVTKSCVLAHYIDYRIKLNDLEKVQVFVVNNGLYWTDIYHYIQKEYLD